MSKLLTRKIRRLIYSVPGGLALTLIAASITGIGLIFQILRSPSGIYSQSGLTWLVKYIVAGLILGLVFLLFQTRLEYARRAHDPTWILKYQDNFDGEGVREKRRLAAKILLQHGKELSRIEEIEELDSIDDILDFFEDIGFYVRGEQISPEVAHHHFYHWIRGYWFASRVYIEAWQKKEKERWNHIGELLLILDEVEGETVPLTDKEVGTFLKQESEC